MQQADTEPFRKPSVALDSVPVTIDGDGRLRVLLVKRSWAPSCDRWALPGGFLNLEDGPGADPDLETAVRARCLKKTGVRLGHLVALTPRGNRKRDERDFVVSLPYLAPIPTTAARRLALVPGEGVSLACWHVVQRRADQVRLVREDGVCETDDLAFDHKSILEEALDTLEKRAFADDLVTWLANDGESFTLPELKRAAMACAPDDRRASNFNRDAPSYMHIEPTGETIPPYHARTWRRQASRA